MYAIVEIAGQQFKVEEGKKIFVHRLGNEEGSRVEFERVLLVEDGETIIVGEPLIKDYVVEGKVIDHVRGDKVIVFKKKRKKGYRVKNGHRQNFTQVEITGIGEPELLRKRVPKEEKKIKKVKPEVVVEPVAAEISVEKKPVTRKKTVTKAEKPVKDDAGTKAPAAKKATEKKPVIKKTTKKKE